MRPRKQKKCCRCRENFPQNDEHFPRTPSGKFFASRCHACDIEHWAKLRDCHEKRAIKFAIEEAKAVKRANAPRWQKLQVAMSKAITGKTDDAVLVREFGYTATGLRAHLERQFARGMTWENYAGNLPWGSKARKWHADHILPKVSFGYDERRTAYAMTNLRPLWERQNLLKGQVRELLI